MPVITVLGEIDPEELGVTAPHEHIFIDCRKVFDEFPDVATQSLAEQKVDITNLGILRRNHRALRDNLLLSDLNVARQELLEFKKAGGRTIVDLSTVGLGRDPARLRELSKDLGINIIVCCGYYKEKFHPGYVKEKTVDELARLMIADIRVGIDGTNVRAGVIGEIGTSREILPDEKKVLKAAAIAQVETGAPLSIHVDPWSENGREVLDILAGCNADLSRTVICHVDAKINPDYCKAILEKGAMMEFDNFGKEYGGDLTGLTFARDGDRIQALKKFIEMGFVSQLLISTDICLKTDLHRYGGWGYDHILTNLAPIMAKNGITQKQLNVIMVENPGRLFVIASKPKKTRKT